MPQWLFKYSIYSKSWGIVLHNQCTQETWHCIKLSIWNWFNFYSKLRIRPSRVLWIILRTFDNVNVNNFRNEEMTSWLRVQDLMIFIAQLAVLPCSDRPGIGNAKRTLGPRQQKLWWRSGVGASHISLSVHSGCVSWDDADEGEDTPGVVVTSFSNSGALSCDLRRWIWHWPGTLCPRAYIALIR